MKGYVVCVCVCVMVSHGGHVICGHPPGSVVNMKTEDAVAPGF